MDADALKDFIDGRKLDVEIMYGTKEVKPHQCKLLMISNNDLNVKGDEGVRRRMRVQLYKTQFKDGVDDDERHKAILFVFDVVSRAVRRTCSPPKSPEPSRSHSSLHVSDSLPAMGAYFEAFDNFVHGAELVGTMDDILRSFEESDSCPLFTEYVMWPRATRLAVAQNRFPHMA